MRLFPFALAAASLAAAVSAQDPAPAPAAHPAAAEKAEPPRVAELGRPLPRAFELPDIDGKVHASEAFKGHITVVNFWSTTCPIMRGWEPALKELHEQYHEKGIAFWMVNSNEANGEIADGEAKGEAKPYQQIRDHLAELALPYQVLVDHNSVVADLFDAKCTPDVFVFDAQGVLVYRGLIDNDLRGDKGEGAEHYLRDVLDHLLAGDKVTPKATRPQGCSIKRPEPPRDGTRRGRRK